MHWCLGIYGSGSTWIYNAVRKIALALDPERPLLAPFVATRREIPTLNDLTCLVIVKSHDTDEAAATVLSAHADRIWISIRDPRDCVTSLVQHHNLAFPIALNQVSKSAHYCARFTNHPHAIVFRYEAGFPDDVATLDRIAEGFGGTLLPADRARIFAELRRPAIEAFIKQLDKLPTALRPGPDKLVDPVTKWHNHHANRTGESGRWRRLLTAAQAAEVEQSLGDWMRSFSYPGEMAAWGVE